MSQAGISPGGAAGQPAGLRETPPKLAPALVRVAQAGAPTPPTSSRVRGIPPGPRLGRSWPCPKASASPPVSSNLPLGATPEWGLEQPCPLWVQFPQMFKEQEAHRPLAGGITLKLPQLWSKSWVPGNCGFPIHKMGIFILPAAPSWFPACNDRAEGFDVPDERPPQTPRLAQDRGFCAEKQAPPSCTSPRLWEAGSMAPKVSQPHLDLLHRGPPTWTGAGVGVAVSKDQLLLGPSRHQGAGEGRGPAHNAQSSPSETARGTLGLQRAGALTPPRLQHHLVCQDGGVPGPGQCLCMPRSEPGWQPAGLDHRSGGLAPLSIRPCKETSLHHTWSLTTSTLMPESPHIQ